MLVLPYIYINDIEMVKKYHLKLANIVCFGLGAANALRDYIDVAFEQHFMLLFFAVLLIYSSMMTMWILVFSNLEPINREDTFYDTSKLLKLFIQCIIVSIPYIVLGYWSEANFAKSVEGIDVIRFIELYALRLIFEFGLVLTFKYMIDSQAAARNYLQEALTLKEANTKAQFEILKQQINPHFLFNALSTLKSLIRIQDVNAEHFVMSLSDVYRKLLLRRDKELIALVDEIEIVNSYLFMQNIRFEGSLIASIDVKAEHLEQTLIPPFALQLLVENTIKHNIISQRKPLTIRIYTVENQYIVIENTLQHKKNIEESTGWGLSNIIARFEAFTSQKIEITESEDLFKVALPLIRA